MSYDDAVKGTYTESSVGTSFGPTWSTHWFRVEYEIPAEWKGEEVHLVWDSGTEAMVWKDGAPLQVTMMLSLLSVDHIIKGARILITAF